VANKYTNQLIISFLEGLDPLHERRQLLEEDLPSHLLTMGMRRCSAEDKAWRNVFCHAGLPGRRDPVVDLDMAIDPNLTGENDKVAQLGTSGNSDMGTDDTVLAHDHIMSDLDKVIDLGPLSNARLGKAGPVDTGIGSDLDLILENYGADLRQALVPIGIGMVTESVCANHCPVIKTTVYAKEAIPANDRTVVEP
jgi:hypothetical protein